MAESPTRNGPTAVPAATTAIKTMGASGWAIVRSILATNVDTVPRSITVGIHTAAADAAGRRIASAVVVPPNDAIELLEKPLHLLGGGSPDVLYALCSSASAINITTSQVEGP